MLFILFIAYVLSIFTTGLIYRAAFKIDKYGLASELMVFIIVALIPFINILLAIGIYVFTLIDSKNFSDEDLMKKILFIKDKKGKVE